MPSKFPLLAWDITVDLKSLLKPGSQVCFEYSDFILNYEYQISIIKLLNSLGENNILIKMHFR